MDHNIHIASYNYHGFSVSKIPAISEIAETEHVTLNSKSLICIKLHIHDCVLSIFNVYMFFDNNSTETSIHPIPPIVQQLDALVFTQRKFLIALL